MKPSGVDSGAQGAPIVENLIGLQVGSPSGVDSGVQGAPIVDQLIGLQVFGYISPWDPTHRDIHQIHHICTRDF